MPRTRRTETARAPGCLSAVALCALRQNTTKRHIYLIYIHNYLSLHYYCFFYKYIVILFILLFFLCVVQEAADDEGAF